MIFFIFIHLLSKVLADMLGTYDDIEYKKIRHQKMIDAGIFDIQGNFNLKRYNEVIKNHPEYKL